MTRCCTAMKINKLPKNLESKQFVIYRMTLAARIGRFSESQRRSMPDSSLLSIVWQRSEGQIDQQNDARRNCWPLWRSMAWRKWSPWPWKWSPWPGGYSIIHYKRLIVMLSPAARCFLTRLVLWRKRTGRLSRWVCWHQSTYILLVWALYLKLLAPQVKERTTHQLWESLQSPTAMWSSDWSSWTMLFPPLTAVFFGDQGSYMCSLL